MAKVQCYMSSYSTNLQNSMKQNPSKMSIFLQIYSPAPFFTCWQKVLQITWACSLPTTCEPTPLPSPLPLSTFCEGYSLTSHQYLYDLIHWSVSTEDWAEAMGRKHQLQTERGGFGTGHMPGLAIGLGVPKGHTAPMPMLKWPHFVWPSAHECFMTSFTPCR